MAINLWLHQLQTPLTEAGKQNVQQQLEAYINELITTDFNRLVQWLYTVDVDEQKVKQLLHAQPGCDAAQLIARLIVTRQQEKIEFRQTLKRTASTGDAERW